MIPISINDKPYTLPSSWNEVTVHQWLQLRYATKLSSIIAVLADVYVEDIRKSTDVEMDNRLWPLLEWYTKPPQWDQLKPKPFLNIKDKALRVPDSLGYSTYEQVENLKNYFAEELKDNTDQFHNLIVPAVAMWAQPQYDEGPYDEYKAKEFEKELMNCSIMEVYPLATFFFRKHLGLQSLRPKPLKPGLRTKIILTLRESMQSLLQRLDHLERSITLQKATQQSSMTSFKWNTTSYSATGPTKPGSTNMKKE